MALNKATGDFVTTVISTGSQLSAGGTSMTIGTGLTLPATNGVLQIDYDSTQALGAASGPETVTYAAYNSANGQVTGMVRGLAGTTGVTHENGASVQCGPSAAYGSQGTILNADLSTVTGEIGGAWKSWTPTLSGRFNNGKWTKTAVYTQVGKLVHFRIHLVANAATPMDGGSVGAIFSLPVTSVSYAGTAGMQNIGTAQILDTGSASYACDLIWSTTTTAVFKYHGVSGTLIGTADPTSTGPMTWASGDEIHASGFYEAA